MLDWLLRRRGRPTVPLVLYTRAGCGLCEEVKREIELARLPWRWTLTEVDIDRDPARRAEYDRSVPVLWIGGQVAFKGRMTAAEFARKFERLGAQWLRAQELARALPPK